MSIATSILIGCVTAFCAGLFGWMIRAAPIDDPLQDEIGDHPHLADIHEAKKRRRYDA